MTSVFIYSKAINKTLRVITHIYFTIPSLDLEIHPGQFFNGTHHKLGTFKRESVKIGEKKLCDICLQKLLQISLDLTSAWYYPIINCESLTRGLIYTNPISLQTIFLTIILTFFIIGILTPIYFFCSLFFTISLIVHNNINIFYSVDMCLHLKQKQVTS
ncbi:Ac81 [Dikerogammarus haemobaphes nudivirus]|nr:Ac81 [Dikerogammarus haemobaphes nudivirus]